MWRSMQVRPNGLQGPTFALGQALCKRRVNAWRRPHSPATLNRNLVPHGMPGVALPGATP